MQKQERDTDVFLSEDEINGEIVNELYRDEVGSDDRVPRKQARCQGASHSRPQRWKTRQRLERNGRVIVTERPAMNRPEMLMSRRRVSLIGRGTALAPILLFPTPVRNDRLIT